MNEFWKTIRFPHICPETGDVFVNYKDIHSYVDYGRGATARTDFTPTDFGQIIRNVFGDYEPTWQDYEDEEYYDDDDDIEEWQK